MKTHLASALLLCLLAGCHHPADTAPQSSVLIQSQRPKRANVPSTVEAFGTATASSGGSLTLSKAVEGQVVALRVAVGELVHKGQPLLEFQLSSTAASALTQAATAREAARAEQARIDRLLSDNLATRDQKSQADKAAADAEAAFNAATADAGPSVRQVIAAPFDGVVDAITVAQGERVAAGAALLTLTRRQGLVVTCGVEPADMARVSVGQKAQLQPLAGGDALNGAVSKAGSVVNDKSRLVDFEIGSDQPLVRGLAYRARIEVGTLSGWSVPAAAVLDDEQGSYLFQVSGKTAKRVAVKRLATSGANVLVDGPLDPKREVVVAGAYQLSDGAQVRTDAPAAPGRSGGRT